MAFMAGGQQLPRDSAEALQDEATRCKRCGHQRDNHRLTTKRCFYCTCEGYDGDAAP